MSEPLTIHGATTAMPSREFQVRTGRDARRRETERRRQRLLGSDGRVRPEYLVARLCPTCGADEGREAFVAGGVGYRLCAGCGLLFVPRYVGAKGRAALYPDSEENGRAYLSPLQRAWDEPKFRHGVELLARLAPAPVRALDVGTASGLFLELMAERGLAATGIEKGPLAYGARHAELGLDVRYGLFEELELAPGSFSAVTFWDCLEHLFDPGAALASATRLLVPGGVVLVLVPNAGSLAARVLQERCAMFDGVQHINMYAPRTLADFARRRGLELVHLESIIPEINVLTNYLEYEDPYEGASTELERVLGLPGLDAAFVLEHLLGYKLLAVLRAS